MTQEQQVIAKKLTEAKGWLVDANRLLTRASPDRIDALDSLRIAVRRIREVEDRIMQVLAHG